MIPAYTAHVIWFFITNMVQYNAYYFAFYAHVVLLVQALAE